MLKYLEKLESDLNVKITDAKLDPEIVNDNCILT